MAQKTFTQADLRQFTGSEHWYRHSIVHRLFYTDGVRHVAEYGGAYWLIDEIALAQTDRAIAAEGFQVWKLAIKADQMATLTCNDVNGRIIHEKQLEFTDFPLKEIRFYVTNNTILLPSEY